MPGTSSDKAEKPDCYQCLYRRNIPGDTHSACAHPDAMRTIAVAVSGVSLGGNLLYVSGAQHGVKMGWFFWPFNFDPIWLEKCSGFKNKESE